MFISDFFNWVLMSDTYAKLILAIGLGGIFIIWKMHKEHEEQNNNIVTRDIPEWTKKYIKK